MCRSLQMAIVNGNAKVVGRGCSRTRQTSGNHDVYKDSQRVSLTTQHSSHASSSDAWLLAVIYLELLQSLIRVVTATAGSHFSVCAATAESLELTSENVEAVLDEVCLRSCLPLCAHAFNDEGVESPLCPCLLNTRLMVICRYGHILFQMVGM